MRKEYVATGKTLDEAIANVCALANTTIDQLDDWDVLEAGKSGFLGIGRRDFKVVAYVEAPEPAAAPEKTSTFGKKKSKREKFEEKAAKAAKKTQDIELRPIVTAQPDQEALAAAEQERSQKRNKRERKPRPERSERPERPERQAKSGAERAERAERSERRRDSHALVISEGEQAERLYAEARAFLDPIFAKLGVAPEITAQVREGILWLIIRGDDLGILIGRRGETLNSLQYLVNLAVNKRRHEHARLVLDVSGYRESREETLTALARKMADKAARSGRRVELEPMNPHERRVVHIALQEDKRVDTVSHGEEPYRRVVINPKNKRRRDRKGKPGQDKAETGRATVDNVTAEQEAVLVMPAETAPELVTSFPAPVEEAPVEAMAESVAEPMPEPMPEPVAEPMPEPMPEPVAEPAPEPMPEPVAEPAPESAPEPAPEQPLSRFAAAAAAARAATEAMNEQLKG